LGREEEENMACQKCGKDPCACPGTPAVAVIDHEAVRNDERQRAAAIIALGTRWNEPVLAADAVARGIPLDTFRSQIMDQLEKRNGQPMSGIMPNDKPRVLGMGRREIKGFSFLRLLNSMANPGSRVAAEAARGEMEACEAWASIAGLRAGAVAVPPDVYVLPRRNTGMRTISDTTEGADMTPVIHQGAQFIDVLRASRPVMARATLLGGLTGDVQIPRQTAATSASFKAEATAGDETTPTYDSISLTPHKLTAWTEPTKQALMQFSPDLETLIRADLFNAAMTKLESVLIDGGDTAEPDGLLDLSGVGSVTASGGKLSWVNVCDLEGEVDSDNALEGDLAYITNAAVKSQMKRTEISDTSTGQFIFDRQSPGSPVNGYPLLTTNLVPRTLGAGGNYSACIFGNLADILLGVWENVELLVNPYSKDKEGIVRVTLYHWVDFGFRHAESFATCVDIDPTAI
jgi:HK97 family phage major capsid protein